MTFMPDKFPLICEIVFPSHNNYTSNIDKHVIKKIIERSSLEIVQMYLTDLTTCELCNMV